MNWNSPLINGFPDQPFISKESFKLYSFDADYDLMDIDHFSDSDVDRPIVSESVEKISKPQPAKATKVKQQKKIPPPFFSALTREQHRKYLDLCVKYRLRAPSNYEEQRELNTLKELHVTVANEQNEFMKYLRSVAELNSENYLFIKENYEAYVNKFLENQRKRVLSYPKFYVLFNAIPFAGDGSKLSNTFFRKNVLLEMGHVPKVIIHNVGKGKVILPHNINKISARFPCENCHEEFVQDVNVEMLASEFGADVAMSFASLECLFDNHAPNFSRQWEMPLTVKKDCNGKKLLMIGDPFVTRSITIPEKSQIFHDFSVKTHFINQHHTNYFDLDTGMENKNKSNENIWEETDDGEEDKRCLNEGYGSEELFERNDDELTGLEGGVISDVMTQQKKLVNVSSDEESLVIDEPSMSMSPIKSFDGPSMSPIKSFDGQNDEKEGKKSQRNVVESTMMSRECGGAPSRVNQSFGNVGNSLRNSDHQPCTQQMRCSTDNNPTTHHNYIPVKSSEGYKRPNEGNVSYSLMEVGRCNVLVRNSYHGFMKVKKHGNIIEIFTKLEYQRAHGFEKLSISELSRIWLALQVKPAVKFVLLARVDPFTTELVHHEKITRDVLNHDFQKCLHQLEVIVKALADLDTGSYLISHTPGNAHFQIKKNTISQNGTYNLHLAHEKTEVKIGAHETFERTWLPIDVEVRGNLHSTSKIPCTFEPRDNRVTNTKSKKK